MSLALSPSLWPQQVIFLPVLASTALARSGSRHHPCAAYCRVFHFASPDMQRLTLPLREIDARSAHRILLPREHRRFAPLLLILHRRPPVSDRKVRTAVPWQGQHAARKGPTAGVLIRRLGRSSSLSSCSPSAMAMSSSSHILP
jgi:hypothetical protein